MKKSNDDQMKKNAKDIEELSKSFTDFTKKSDEQFASIKDQIKEQNYEKFASIQEQIKKQFAEQFTALFTALSKIPIVPSSGEMSHNTSSILHEESSGFEGDEMSNLEGGTLVTEKETPKVFDELHKPAKSTTTACKSFENDSDVYTGMYSQTGAIFEQVLGNSEDKALNKSTGIQFLEKVEGSILTKQEDIKDACKVFDVMPMLFFFKPKDDIGGNVDPIPLVYRGPRVFDPGTSISLCMNNELFNKLLQPSIISTTCLKSISGQCHSFASFLGQCKSVLSFTSTDLVFIFDPGGCGEPFGFWIEEVVCMLYCHLLECSVSFLWSHIISLVDEIKRADMGNEECCKLFCIINGVVGSSWLDNCGEEFEFSNARPHHDRFSAIKAGSVFCWLCFGCSNVVVTVQAHTSKPFDINFDSMVVGAENLESLILGPWLKNAVHMVFTNERIVDEKYVRIVGHHFRSHLESKELHLFTLDPHDGNRNENSDKEVPICLEVSLDSNVLQILVWFKLKLFSNLVSSLCASSNDTLNFFWHYNG